MKKNYKSQLGLFALIFLALTKLSAQQTFTFTNAGATGRFGPSQGQITTAYQTTNLNGSVTANAGRQTFTVPAGVYRIAAYGAQGGNQASNLGGLGARIEGDFVLTTPSTLNILVGQQGEISNNNTGGGGGTFVWITGQPQPLVAAGAGGGAGFGAAGINAVTVTAGTAGSGVAGLPGTGGNGANPGGGGWLTTGTDYVSGTTCALKCTGNIVGVTVGGATPTTAIVFHGCSGSSDTGDGGFGGGSGGNGNCTSSHGGGGGGGYSGGAGQTGASASGGGGGSYNGGTNQLNVAGTNSGHGRVIITELCSVKIANSSTGFTSPAILCSGNSLTLTTDAISNYSWSTGQTTSSIVVAPTTNTVYSVTGTSSMNCTATGVINVIVSSGVPVLSISNPSANICLGRTVSLTATGAITYTWTNVGIVNGQTFTPSGTAAYTVTGQNGCGTSVATTTINVAPLPVTSQVTPTLICQGYPATLTANSAVSGYTWQPTGQTGSLVTVAPNANTIYTVTASDGTCSGTQVVLLSTKTTPTITTSQTLTSICEGEAVNLSASGAGIGGTYSWTPGGSGASISMTPPTSTAVVVAGTNSLNCTSSAQQIIIVNLPPPLTVAANKTLVCTGDAIVLTGSGAGSYQWTSGPNTAGYTVNPTSPLTVYTVTGSQSSNSCTVSRTIAVAAIIPNVTVSSSLAVCQGGSVTLTATGANTYTWNGFSTGSSGVYQVTPLATTVYTITSTTSSLAVNCLRTDYSTVTVNPLPTISVTATKETICKGGTHTLTASGAATYSWSNVAGTSNMITVTLSGTTVYTVTGIDSKGCEGTVFYAAKVSNCTNIAELSGLQGISVYPNPSNGEFVVAANSDIALKVVNSIGQEVRTLNLNNSNDHKAHVKDLSVGVYFIVGENAEGKVMQKMIITK